MGWPAVSRSARTGIRQFAGTQETVSIPIQKIEAILRPQPFSARNSAVTIPIHPQKTLRKRIVLGLGGQADPPGQRGNNSEWFQHASLLLSGHAQKYLQPSALPSSAIPEPAQTDVKTAGSWPRRRFFSSTPSGSNPSAANSCAPFETLHAASILTADRGAFGRPGDHLLIDIDAQRLAALGADGGISGQIELAGTPAQPMLNARLQADTLGVPARFSARGLKLNAQLAEGDDAPLQLDLRVQQLSTSGQGTRLRDLKLLGDGSRRQHQLNGSVLIDDTTPLLAAAGGLLGNDSVNLVQQLKQGFGLDELGVRQGALDGSGGRTPGSRVAGSSIDSTATTGNQILTIGKRLSSNAEEIFNKLLESSVSMPQISRIAPLAASASGPRPVRKGRAPSVHWMCRRYNLKLRCISTMSG